jgi:hypothetical protein
LFNKRSENCRDEIGNWDCGGGGLEFGDTVEDTIKKLGYDNITIEEMKKVL